MRELKTLIENKSLLLLVAVFMFINKLLFFMIISHETGSSSYLLRIM